MRIAIATAVAAGALLLTIPAAAANASTPGVPVNLSSAPCGSASGFQQVAVGQSVAQVNQEMGAAGETILDNTSHGHENLEISWRDCDASGLFSFNVSFTVNPGQPATVDSKAFDPTVPSL